MLLKKFFSLFILTIVISFYFYNKKEYVQYEKDIDEIIDSYKIKKYDGYFSIPKYNYKRLIKSGNSKQILDSNNIFLLNNGGKVDDEKSNIVLAGHNNKYVFSILYKLKDEDIIEIFYKNKLYSFKIYKRKIIDIKDTYILDNIKNDKILTLITCTNNNQKRFIVLAKLYSHNFP